MAYCVFGDRNVSKIMVTFLQLYAVTTVCLLIAITVTHRGLQIFFETIV